MAQFTAQIQKVVVGMAIGLVGISSVGWASEIAWRPVGWVIESADYTGEVKDQIARFEIRYAIRLVQDGWVEVPLDVQGATVTSIDLKKKTENIFGNFFTARKPHWAKKLF